MALTSGFFNSLNGDRKYYAEQLSDMFEGLISGGIYENVGAAFIVTPSSGLTLSVGSGRAIVDDKWVKNDAAITITLNAAHVTLNRYTAIVLRKNFSTRDITLEMIDGANASNPTKPAIVRNASSYDICLAYVYVGAGATNITQANITDMRTNTSVCGWVTGIIQQVDTSQLFLQYQTAYEEFFEQLESWKNTQETDFDSWETAQKSAFDSWFAALTEELQVNTYIEQYHKFVQLAYSDSKVVPLDMTGYTYDASDVFFISLNGLTATEVEDYLIDTSTTPPEVHLNFVGSANQVEDVDIKVLKSKIGYTTN